MAGVLIEQQAACPQVVYMLFGGCMGPNCTVQEGGVPTSVLTYPMQPADGSSLARKCRDQQRGAHVWDAALEVLANLLSWPSE